MAAPQTPGWKADLANQLGVKLTPAVAQFFDNWTRAEGGGAENNPFNTTQPEPGAGTYNSVGVRRYTSPDQGIAATVQTLRNGRYGNILAALGQGNDPVAMARALANSPWGTGSLVLKMLGASPGPPPPLAPGDTAPAAPGAQTVNAPAPLMPMPNDQMKLQTAINQSLPPQSLGAIMQSMGGPAAQAWTAAQQPFTVPGAANVTPQQSSAPGSQSSPTDGGQQTDPYTVPTVPVQSKLVGQVPMHQGGDITARYPNVHAQSQVDWSHINPRLLHVLQQVAEKEGVSIVLSSGYRSNQYSQSVGGFANDPHTRGVAVDAYINGHPVGDVIPPEVWAKYGVRSGNTPGFYHGKPDPEHLDLVGVPIKGQRR